MSSIRVEDFSKTEIPIPTMPTIEVESVFNNIDYVEALLVVCFFVSLYQSFARICIKLCTKSKKNE